MSRIEINKNNKHYEVIVSDYRAGTRMVYDVTDMKYSREYNMIILYNGKTDIGTISLDSPEDRIIWDPEDFDISIRNAIEHLERGC